MSETGITLDTTRWQRALRSYMHAVKKDAATVLNKRGRNVCFRTVQFLPKADKGRIRNLPKHPWWPKYIAKRISGQGLTMTLHRKAKGAKTFKGRTARTFTIQGRYTVQQARLVSRQIVARRARAVGFLGSGPVKAGRMLTGSGVSVPGGYNNPAAVGYAIPATLQKLETVMKMSWKGRNIGRGRDIVHRALQRAIDYDAKDMMNEVRRRLAENNAKYSGQGVR